MPRGLMLDIAGIRRIVERTVVQHASHKASMLQDREAGCTTEIEFINGAIARVGDAFGVAIPVTSTLADPVRLVENGEIR